MRVKIQYTTRVEDLPNEVEILRKKASEKLRAQLESLTELGLEDVKLSSLETLGDIRENLLDVDFLLSDVDAIVRDFCGLHANPERSHVAATPKEVETGD